jgi:hypothetical protein
MRTLQVRSGQTRTAQRQLGRDVGRLPMARQALLGLTRQVLERWLGLDRRCGACDWRGLHPNRLGTIGGRLSGGRRL